MLNKILSRTPLHEHADPAQRVLGVDKLPPESSELFQLMRADPVAEVRPAAARRCGDGAAVIAGWQADIGAVPVFPGAREIVKQRRNLLT